VLTNFDIEQLEELWLLEQLAGDLHLCSIVLRAIPRGGGLRSRGNWFNLAQSNELEKLAAFHDRRLGRFEASATATVIDYSQTDGSCMLAGYNALKITDYFEEVGRAFTGKRIRPSTPTLFIWFSFPLRNFYEAHQPLEKAFRNRNGCNFKAILFILGGLSLHAVGRWPILSQLYLHWCMALDEGISREQILNKVNELMPHICATLRTDPVSTQDLSIALDYLTLTESKRALIEPLLGGPVFPILPVNDRFLIDYAWATRLLDTLFFGVRVDDQNFKGDALENLVGNATVAALPRHRLVAYDDTSKQIDSSFISGDVLVIAECRAFGRSIAYDRGSADAMNYRRLRIDGALSDSTDKAEWIAKRPLGRNYALDKRVKWICPVVVTPFVEFVPSLSPVYWLTDEIARVLTPSELHELAKENTLDQSCRNVVQVRW